VTTWAISEPASPRDQLDELFPGRARRRLSSLRDRAFPALEQVRPGRWRTVDVEGLEADWLEVTVDSDPFVVHAGREEAVRGAGEALVPSGALAPIPRSARAPAAKRGASRRAS